MQPPPLRARLLAIILREALGQRHQKLGQGSRPGMGAGDVVENPGLAFLLQRERKDLAHLREERECALSSDGANLDVGSGALRDGRGEEWEEGLDRGAAEGGRISTEEGGGEGCFRDGEFGCRHVDLN